MNSIITPILPKNHTYAKEPTHLHELHLEAICVFVATGFFLDEDSYWKDEVCLSPAHEHTLDAQNKRIKSKPWFEWYYEPRAISFQEALEEYIALLTTITKEQIKDHPVILPLSGGLDSRSQALILKDLNNPVQAYSYAFPGGYPEHKISAKIAKVCGFDFKSFMIPKGYLWESIDELAQINGCYSEFTHPRQMGVLDELKKMNGLFSLGHWGDVLFDRGVPDGTKEKDVIPLLLKKMLKPGGLELAEQLWQAWGLPSNFKAYLESRIEVLLAKIKIEDLNAKVRAFKTTHWAHRWTTTNLSIFEAAHPISMPFYDDRMCQFICTVPEAFLANRQLQIAHLRQNDDLSRITWHEQKPFHLNNYHLNKTPYNLPYRVVNKMKRELNALLGNPYIQRNYELQFLGADNDEQLRQRIFNTSFFDFIPEEIVRNVYQKFKNIDNVYHSHPTSILLTLAVWHQQNHNK